MTEKVHRFMNVRDLMSVVAGNWASLHSDLESEEPSESDGLLAVEIPWVRFNADPGSAEEADCRGGLITLDLASLDEDEDYRREADAVYVAADTLVSQELAIQLRP